jgi:inositol-pentakisphosphate 2-kinase
MNSLTKELRSEDLTLDSPVLRDRFVSTIMPPLVNTPVLRTLSDLQRSLDVLDIEGLSRLWALSHSQPPDEISSTFDAAAEYLPPLGSTSAEPSIADWTAFVDEYIPSHASLDHTQPQTSNLRYYLLAYLLSATFKDCSIMVRVNQGQDSGTTGEMRNNSVTVIDLDPKSIQRLRKWEKLDKEISESCIGFEVKNCVDGWKHN